VRCSDGALREAASDGRENTLFGCANLMSNCMKKGISVHAKISEFKLFRHNESFYFMDEIVMNPIKE